jgi:hypothetical protein
LAGLLCVCPAIPPLFTSPSVGSSGQHSRLPHPWPLVSPDPAPKVEGKGSPEGERPVSKLAQKACGDTVHSAGPVPAGGAPQMKAQDGASQSLSLLLSLLELLTPAGLP